MASGKLAIALFSCVSFLLLAGGLATAKDVHIPLSCRDSVRAADVLQIAVGQGQLPYSIRKEIARTVLCEAVGRRGISDCGKLAGYGSDLELACRKDFLFASLATYSQNNIGQLLSICQSVFSGSKMIRPSGMDVVCQALVEAAQTRNLSRACSAFADYAQDMKDPSRGGEVCRESLAFISGSSACRGVRGDGLIECSELAAMMTAEENGSSQACGHSGACLAAYRKNPEPCGALSRRAISSFCSDSSIPVDVKNMAKENAFRRVYHYGPYSPGQPFLAHDMVMAENKLRDKRGLPPFRLGDKLLSMTSPSGGQRRQSSDGDAGSDGDSSQR